MHYLYQEPEHIYQIRGHQSISTTHAGRPFLLYDSGDQDRVPIFATQEKLTLLENSNNWFVDGTFDTMPLIYTQLFMQGSMER